jgi:HlyD family secretion protein
MTSSFATRYFHLFGVVLTSTLWAASCKGGESKAARLDAGQAVSVDEKTAQRGRIRGSRVLVGTTQPVEQVAVRSRVEGHIESLTVDVGDSVKKDQELGRVDPTLLDAAYREAQAAVAAARAQAARAHAAVAQAESAQEQSRLAATQAQVEAKRYEGLSEKGIASRQEAEQRATAAKSAEKALDAAAQQIRTEESLREAAEAQVQAQAALLSAARERRSFATLRSPMAGRVVARLHSAGDVVLAGAEVFRIGDFSRVEVALSISELELSRVERGKTVRVRLDAFPEEVFTGTIARISPQADPASRLVPLEIVLENPKERIGAGLLARVELDEGGGEAVVVPESALSVMQAKQDAGATDATATILVLQPTQDGQGRTEARSVQVGSRADGQVEILGGLKEGEPVVVRSARPLTSGVSVRTSALSDVPPSGTEEKR